MTLLLALAALSAAAAPAPEVPKAPERALLVVEFRAKAKSAGFPARCPDADPNEEPDPESICTAAFFEGPVRIVRRLSGPDSVRGARLRYTAHAYPMFRGMRLLVIAHVRPDGAGLFASWWEWPDERGEVCLDDGEAARLEIADVWRQWPERVIIGEGDGKSYPVRCLNLGISSRSHSALRGVFIRSN